MKKAIIILSSVVFVLATCSFTTCTVSAQSWNALGTTGANNFVYSLARGGNYLYAGGLFSNAGGGAGESYVARWNGTAWSNLGTGMDNSVLAFAAGGSNLYAGGNFFSTPEWGDVRFIGKWNGTGWSGVKWGVGPSAAVSIRALAWDGSNLYAGGSFTQTCGNYSACNSGNTTVNSVAKWDGSSWSTLGTGMNGTVYALAWDGNNLYAGGDFTTAGGVAASKIAKWNGSTWSALGSGTNATVFSLAWDGSNLYAGGSFSTAGGNPANRVAQWNGGAWSALGFGVDGSSVYALAWDGGSSTLYAGGNFTNACGNAACSSGNTTVNKIARWNGSAWSALGFGVSGDVYALTANGSCLYAGGIFVNACGNTACSSGNTTVNYIAAWGAASCVTALPIELLSFSGVCEEDMVKLLWQTASETNNDYFTIERSSHFDGKSWDEVGTVEGSGNSAIVRSYEFIDNILPLLTDEESRVRYYRLKQTDYDGKYEYFGPVSTNCGGENGIAIYPTLSHGQFFIQNSAAKIQSLDIYNTLGEEVYSIDNPINQDLLMINLSSQPSGIYFARVISENKKTSQKIIIY